jgi:hypothetical protein
MADLSNQALDVFWAFNAKASGRYGEDYHFMDAIAAALRASARSMKYGWDAAKCVDHLCSIAAELENR